MEFKRLIKYLRLEVTRQLADNNLGDSVTYPLKWEDELATYEMTSKEHVNVTPKKGLIKFEHSITILPSNEIEE